MKKILLIICFLPIIVFSQDFHAVIVGIGDYEGTINDREALYWDARNMRDYLRDYAGWHNTQLNLILNADGTHDNILSAIEDLPKNYYNNDLFFSSTHGSINGIDTYDNDIITPSDITNEFGTNFNSYACIIEACHSGIFPDNMSKGVICSACEEDEQSWSGGWNNNDVYSGFLLYGIVYNNIRNIEDLHNYASPLTTNESNYWGHSQHPQISDNYTGKFIIGYTCQGSLEVNEDWYDNVTLHGHVTVPSNVTLTIKSGSMIVMDDGLGSFSITSTGGTIIVENFESFENNYFCLKNSDGTIRGLYPSFWSATGNLLSGMTLDVGSDFSVIYCNKTLPTGSTLNILSDVSINLLYGHYIRRGSGTITLSNENVNITPEIFGYSSGTLEGLYSDIQTAVTYASTVNVNGGSHSISDNLLIGSTKTLNLVNSNIDFASSRYIAVNGGNLTATGTTFTGTSGTWDGIKYYTGSTGSLNNCNISNAIYGVYLNSSNRTIGNCIISNCNHGVYCYDCITPLLESNTINSSAYGIFNYNSAPKIVGNTISGSTGIYNYNSSPNIGNNEIISTGSSIICCENHSSPNVATLEGSSASNYCHASNVSMGIFAMDDSHPVLGAAECGGNYGDNSFVYNSCYALAYSTEGCSIYAPYNWWGSSSPLASKFIEDGGEITYLPCLTSMPTYSMPGLSPENDLYDARMMLAGVMPDSVEEGLEDLTRYYNDQWELNKKIEFIRYLYTIGEAIGVADICIDIISENPYEPEAFIALDMIYQISKNEKIKKDFNKDMLKTYLKTFENSRSNEFIEASAMLLLAGIEKDVNRMDKVYKKYKNTYMGKFALHQKFMYYFNEEENTELSRSVLNVMDEVYPDEAVTYESHVLMGDEVIEPVEFYSQCYLRNTHEKQLSTPTDIAEIMPQKYTLSPAFPNPFNPSTTLEYILPVQSDVKFSIFDLKGNLVKEYSYVQDAGTYSIVWDASAVSSGIYLIRFVAEASDGSETFVDYQRVSLIK